MAALLVRTVAVDAESRCQRFVKRLAKRREIPRLDREGRPAPHRGPPGEFSRERALADTARTVEQYHAGLPIGFEQRREPRKLR